MRPQVIVCMTKILEGLVHLLDGVAPLQIETFSPNGPIEPLTDSILGWLTRLGVAQLNIMFGCPLRHFVRNKLRPIIATDVLWLASPCHHLLKDGTEFLR